MFNERKSFYKNKSLELKGSRKGSMVTTSLPLLAFKTGMTTNVYGPTPQCDYEYQVIMSHKHLC